MASTIMDIETWRKMPVCATAQPTYDKSWIGVKLIGPPRLGDRRSDIVSTLALKRYLAALKAVKTGQKPKESSRGKKS